MVRHKTARTVEHTKICALADSWPSMEFDHAIRVLELRKTAQLVCSIIG